MPPWSELRWHDWLAAVVLVLAGLAAGLRVAADRRPSPLPGELQITDSPMQLSRTASDPLLVTPEKWLELPMPRGDFDLVADLELGEDVEADLLLRRVEPRLLQGVSLGFHGRFAVLRLSTGGAGEPWRTPETALFGPRGGVRLAAGMSATVQVQVRGRRLEANVAGKRLPPFLATDEHGSLALLARGGSVAVRSLSIAPVPAAAPPHPSWIGGAAGLLLAAIALLRRSGAVRCAVAAALLVGGAELLRHLVLASLPPLAQPAPIDELEAVLAGAPLAVAALLRGLPHLLAAVVGAAALTAAVFSGQERMAGRFPPTPQLDAVFGPAARETIAETLACRVRGPHGVQSPTAAEHRVFLLGGQLMYHRSADPDDRVELLLEGELRARVPAAEVVSAPTVDGWSAQQWQLFDRFYRPFRPQVVVLGVPRYEAASGDDGRPRSSPEQLAATIAAARAGCAELGAELVLLADVDLPAELLAVLRRAAERDGVPLLELRPTDATLGVARKLAELLAPLLRP
ncbi:MAG: hypothetical protein AB7O97_04790 [Planctomycetota bacterium]